MQRALSDSSALRNLGAGFGYNYTAILSCRRGFARVEVDRQRVDLLLEGSPEVLGEAVQTVMRKHGIHEPYERLKEMTRGKKVDIGLLRAFIRSLDLPPNERNRLLEMEPRDYVGLAEELAHQVLDATDD